MTTSPAPTAAVRTLQGVDFQVHSLESAVALLNRHRAERQPVQVAIANAHTLNLARQDPAYRQLLRRFTVLNDGIGIDIASRLRFGDPFPANLNGTDFVPDFLRSAPPGMTVFLLGARPEVAAKAFAAAATRFPQHQWLGFADGFFRADGEPEVIARIRAAQPDLLLVAMGNPLQEFWIDRCAPACGATVCIGVGALFDFWADAVPRAPAWIRKAKLEWAYRLAQEPGRLWRRYLVGNLTFLWHALSERRR